MPNKINQQDRIEEALSEPVTCEDGKPHYIDESNKRYLARQISQLFPQPLDDEELREKIKESILDVLQDFDQYSPCLHKALLDKILALLRTKIEETIDKLRAQVPNLIEEAKEQERERIGGSVGDLLIQGRDASVILGEIDDYFEGQRRQALKGGN